MLNYFSLALKEVGKDWGGHIVAALIYVIIVSVLSATGVGSLALGALLLGYYYYVYRKVNGETAEYKDIWVCISKTELLVPSILAGIVSGLIISVGFVLCIIPGFVACAAFLFTFFIIIDGEMNFWEAMMKSKNIASGNWLKFTLFTFIAMLVASLGSIVIGIGVVVTLPIATVATVLLYNDIKGNKFDMANFEPINKTSDNSEILETPIPPDETAFLGEPSKPDEPQL